MADAFEKRMAKRALASMKGSSSPSAQQSLVAQSARKILQGKASPEDVARVRNYTGDHRGVNSRVGALTKKFRSFSGPIARVTEAVDSLAAMKATGQGTAAAEQRLLRTVVGEFEKFRKGRFVQDTAKNVAKYMGSNPMVAGRFLKSLGRIARGVGAVGAVALGVVQGFEKFYDERRKGAQATSRSIDATRGLNTDARLSAGVRRGAMARVSAADWWVKSPHGTGFVDEFIQNRRAQAAEEEIKKEAEAIAAARPALQELGLDPGMVLGEMARRRGKTIGELTSKEINEAIDTAINEKLKNDRNMKAEKEQYAASKLATQNVFEDIADYFRTDGMMNAKKEGFKKEYEQRVKKSLPVRMAEREEVAEQVKAERGLNTPAQNFLWEDRMRNARASFHASQSRYRAWMND